ncbi:DTW domain-containing protein [Shewanella sp. OPT22]|nr:DTW domain-containing protein [Shewanella sp. OPT22]
MSRHLCSKCQFPASHCLCGHAEKVDCETHLIILQHPSEVKHAKNSVRLLPLSLPNIQIVVGESEADFVELRAWLTTQKKPIYLLYPSDSSRDISETQATENAILIVLDGTWRKAHKMLMLNPWLLAFTHLSITPDRPSNYKIRKASRSDSLSSLEAAAFGIKTLEPMVNISPLLNLFDAMIAQQLAAMPADVRKRYS